MMQLSSAGTTARATCVPCAPGCGREDGSSVPDALGGLHTHAAQGWSIIVAHTWLDVFPVPAGMRAIELPAASAPPVGVLTTTDEPLPLVAAALLDSLDRCRPTSPQG